jgi:hypothetical protein
MTLRSKVDRFVDIGSVFLISIAAVLTALCGYQSGRWSGHQTYLYNDANASRIASGEATGRSNALMMIDVISFLDYINALDAGDTRKADFLYPRFRPEMRAALGAWLATKPLRNAKAPATPFIMRQYTLQTNAEAKRYEEKANADFEAAQRANQIADDFLLATVIFAGVSFMAGVSTKMVYPRHAVLIALATVAMIYGLLRLVQLPFL